MKYDDASWHYGGNFPEDSPIEYGGVHIALFMKWCFIKGWVGKLHLEEHPRHTEGVIKGSMIATEFFFKYCDGKLTNEDFNSEGNKFAKAYYGDDGLFFDDFADQFGDLIYTVPESEYDFEKFSSMMEKRYKSGILTKTEANTSNWKFW